MKKVTAWQRYSKIWNLFLPPTRPSQDDSKNYGLLIAKELKNKQSPKIMVMGSTPELRRVLYTYECLNNAELYCVDINPTTYKAMTQFLAQGRNSHEKFVASSWLSTDFPSRYFDLIIGDQVICQIKPEQHKMLFSEISRILKKNSAWITRHDIYLSEEQKDNPANILINIAEKIKKGEYSFQLAASIILYRFIHYIDTTKSLNTMLNYLNVTKKEYQGNLKNNENYKIVKELIDIIEDNYVKLDDNYGWYVLSEKESEKELEEFFKIKGKVYSSDRPFSKNGPIYMLENKTTIEINY